LSETDQWRFLGLVDQGETPEQAAVRELEEETGFKSDAVLETSPLIVCDPGQYLAPPIFSYSSQLHPGMTNANMKLVTLSVTMQGELELPKQKLESGEFIVRRVVTLNNLRNELES
jgi:ADP-ribose pyrophosphatase